MRDGSFRRAEIRLEKRHDGGIDAVERDATKVERPLECRDDGFDEKKGRLKEEANENGRSESCKCSRKYF